MKKETNEPALDSVPVQYLSLDAIVSPFVEEATSEDFEVAPGMVLRIEGLKYWAHRKEVDENIRVLTEQLKTSSLYFDMPNERCIPTEADIFAAVWCSACVTNPKANFTDWLKFGYPPKHSLYLQRICSRCLVRTGIIGDATMGKPDGVDDAKGMLKNDPLVPSGGAFAEKN